MYFNFTAYAGSNAFSVCLVDIAQPVPYSMEFLILLHYLGILGRLE